MNASKCQQHDIAVIGAGPAGCSAALVLARGGLDVVLIEKATLPRYKTCGGALIGRAYGLLPDSVSKAVEREYKSVELNFLTEGMHFMTTRQEPIILMTMRADLDHVLATEAQRAGAHLIEGCGLHRISPSRDFVDLQTLKGTMRVKFVVAADGANSFVAREAGWGESHNLVPALEYEVFVDDPDFVRLSPTARFDFDVIAHGYAWVFPKRAHISMGILSMRRGRVNLQSALERYFQLLEITSVRKVERHGYVIPIGPRRGPLAKGRILLTGDAAGLVDPVTAEGITYAIQSGRLAGLTLIECFSKAPEVAQSYQSRLEEAILPDLRAGRFLARLMYDHPRLRRWAFKMHGQALSEVVTDVVMGKRTYAGTLKQPSNYLKLFRSRRATKSQSTTHSEVASHV